MIWSLLSLIHCRYAYGHKINLKGSWIIPTGSSNWTQWIINKMRDNLKEAKSIMGVPREVDWGVGSSQESWSEWVYLHQGALFIYLKLSNNK